MGYIMADHGWSPEEAREALSRLEGLGFLKYDDDTETLWVVDLFRHEMRRDPGLNKAEPRTHDDGKKPDTRVAMIEKALAAVHASPFVDELLAKYRPDYPYLLGTIEGACQGTSMVSPRAHARGPQQQQQQQQKQKQHKGESRAGAGARASEGAHEPVDEEGVGGEEGSKTGPSGLSPSLKDPSDSSGEDKTGPETPRPAARDPDGASEAFDAWVVDYPGEANGSKLAAARRAWRRIPEAERPTADAVRAWIAAAKKTERWKLNMIKGLKRFVEERTWLEDTKTYGGQGQKHRPPLRARSDPQLAKAKIRRNVDDGTQAGRLPEDVTSLFLDPPPGTP
jgi:hypothetical protein